MTTSAFLRGAAGLFLAAVCVLGLTPAVQAQSLGQPEALSLAEAVSRALENNLGLEIQRNTFEQSQLGIDDAKAIFDPSIGTSVTRRESTDEPSNQFSFTDFESTSGGVTFSDPLLTGGDYSVTLGYGESVASGPLVFVPDSVDASLSLSYNQPLLRNFGIKVNRLALEQAELETEASRGVFRETILATVLITENRYWDLVSAVKNYDVAVDSLNLADEFLKQTKIKVDVGTLPPIEITTAEAEVASRQVAVIDSEASIRAAQDQLREVMGLDASSPNWIRKIIPTDEPGFGVVQVDLERATETALANRWIVKEFEYRLRANELSRRFRKNQVRPSLDLGLSYQSSGNNFEPDPMTMMIIQQSSSDALSEIGELENTDWSATLSLGYPIGNRRAKADLKRSELAVESSQLQLEDTKLAVAVEVRAAARRVETAQKQVEASRVNAALQRKKLDAEQKRYENGLSTTYQLLEFQTDLTSAENQEVDAIIEFNKALVNLARVQGTLLEERNIVVD